MSLYDIVAIRHIINQSGNAYMTPDQICFYDETLGQQLEGSYRYDGKAIHVCSAEYGARSAPRGGCIAHTDVDLLAQKVLSELAREAEKADAKPQSYKKAA